MPFTIEVKDVDLPEAAKKTVELVKKYNRFHSTALGSKSSAVIDFMLKLDPGLSTFFSTYDVLKLMFGYLLGILPYLHFERDIAALPYMTRDFI